MAAGDPPEKLDSVADPNAATLAGEAAPADSSGGLARGATLGRYLVVGRLGSGGMGVVYSAYDPELDRRLAIKLLRPEPSGSEGATEGRARLLREAQAMARLSHPNVIAVHDVGTYQDQVFVVMELVAGVTLRAWLAGTRHPWQRVR